MAEIELDKAMLLVTGAHLSGEVYDRPLAYQLQQQILEVVDEGPSDVEAIVCCDVWYLNNEQLHGRPTISIGGPGVNALSAYLYQRLENVLTIEDRLVIQLDAEFRDLRVAVWGMDAYHTAEALRLFREKYLSPFLEAVVEREE